jgi:Spy/CpxP family protein refolding chaperone
MMTRPTTLIARLAGAMVATALLATAQAQQAAPVDSAALLAKIQSDKRGLVAKAMNLSADEAAKFWPLYEKFQRELEPVNRRQTRAVVDYVAAEGKLTDANADRLIREALDANAEEAKLRSRHYLELKKVLPATRAARYVQVENKIQAVKRFESAKVIPLAD